MSEATIGRRIRALREQKGLSRRDLAALIGVDTTALAAWERGTYLPRAPRRTSLAKALGTDVWSLFEEICATEPLAIRASTHDTITQLAGLLDELMRKSKMLRALRIAAPYSTPAYVQQDFRTEVSNRLLAGSIEVQRIEIFYSLERLKEALSNVFRYNGCAYNLKCFCTGITEVAPAMGGYYFDDDEFLIGAYWTGVPPTNRPGMHLTGEPFATYFNAYWDEIWRRGTLLNMRGSHDLTAVRTAALALGLNEAAWPQFVEEARELKIGDGAPPLI